MSRPLRRVVRVSTVGMMVGLWTLSCVTVNVNFPENTVQKATDDYVKELYRAKKKGEVESPSNDDASFQWNLFPSAHAEGDLFKVFTPATKRLQSRLQARLPEVVKYKKRGILGESQDGQLVVKDPSSLRKLEKRKVQALVQKENSDRQELYSEVLQANSLPASKKNKIEKSFARSFQAESPSQTWVQGMDGQWSRKR